jgi:hypothetical protein
MGTYRILGTSSNPCFSAEFYADVCHHDDDDYAQDILSWSETFKWSNNYCEFLVDLPCELVTRMLLISNFWHDKLSIYHEMPLEILGLFFWPMIFCCSWFGTSMLE